MNKFFVLTLFLFFPVLNLHGEIKVDFIDSDWDGLLSKAGNEGKYLFVDAFTDWCGWCKVMDKNTFSDDSIADFMNDKLVSAKIDMERGFGIKLAMKYRVTSFPTYLIFDAKGNMVYRVAGYQPPEIFIGTLKRSINKKQQMEFPGLTPEIDLDFPEFYTKSFGKIDRRTYKPPSIKTVVDFLDSQDNKFSEVSWSVMGRFNLNDYYKNFFFENFEKYSKLYGKAETDKTKSRVYYSYLKNSLETKDEKDLDKLMQIIDKYEQNKFAKLQYKYAYYRKLADWKKFGETAAALMDAGYDNQQGINNLCWNIYKDVDDPKIVKKAAGWMKDIIDRNPEYMFLDTYASLLFKLGDYEHAGIYAEKAIKKGNEKGRKTDTSQKLLEKIKEMLK